MKLATLELAGFKSFADTTEFKFDDGITGIVGPNGSGKSNVVDAVKWVLGEMSAKSLRGDAMLDVIFCGSGSRKPTGMAEVSLTFTNEDDRLPVQAPQVKITRRLYRDGTSEYLVNNEMSRLKDIREMFLDTGVGVEAYSIIEQGQIYALLDASGVDRREVFEEAAGISRFKVRKKETLRKLERTDQNLAQVQLVLDEVQRQLRSVKVQAGRARNYQEYFARLNELRKAHSLREYDQLHRRLTDFRRQREELVDNLAGLARQCEQIRCQRQDLQLDMDALTEAARKAERELMVLENQRQSAVQQGQFAQQQITQLSEQLDLYQRRLAELEERKAEQGGQVENHRVVLAEIDTQVKAHEQAVLEAVAQQAQAAGEAASLHRAIEEAKSAALDMMRAAARLNSECSAAQVRKENLDKQVERLQAARSQMDQQIALLEQQLAGFQGQERDLAVQAEELRSLAEGLRSSLAANSRKHAAILEELSKQREIRGGLKSRQSVLMDLQARREGVAKPVQEVLKARDAGGGFAGVKGIAGEYISTSLEHAAIVEAALGEMQNALVLDTSEALLAAQLQFQSLPGRVTALALDNIPPYKEDFSPSALGAGVIRVSDLVTYDQAMATLALHVLGSTLLVESLDQALTLLRQGPRGLRFVTRAAEVVNPDGTVQLGDMSRRAGTISRRSELARLEQDLVAMEVRIGQLSTEAAQCDQQTRELNESQQQLRDQLFTVESQLAQVRARSQQAGQQVQKLRGDLPMMAGELDGVVQEIKECAQRQETYRTQAAEKEVAAQQAEKTVRDMQQQLILRQHEVAEVGENVTKLRVAMGQSQEQRTARARELTVAESALRHAEAELSQLNREIGQVDARVAAAKKSAEDCTREIENLESRRGAAARLVDEQNGHLAGLRDQFQQATVGLDQMESQHAQVQKLEHTLSLSENEVSVRLETLVERTADELQLNLVEAHATYQAVEMDWDAVAAEINDLKGRMARLGNVNIDAIDEQDKLEERQKFLSGQIADIQDAKRQLEELIARINEDSRQKFIDTFEKVRVEFQEMFRRLFGGGRADIVLENPEDVLESGIDILAKPPGKEQQSISLLSGGEKTLAAVAVIMAIFKSKPSPFCILDEVDAALDEANTGRFAAIVSEFMTTSQFIVITHNKAMMNIASLLYGVTMQEQGVSKRVAVRFDGKGLREAPEPSPTVALASEAA
jgi:chromosome segregation protein